MTPKTTKSQRSRPAFVVGGAGAIGSAITAHLVASGRQAVVMDLHEPRQTSAPFQRVDITRVDDVERTVAAMITQYGVPETLICAAGYLRSTSILDLTPAELQRHLDVNLLGAMNVSQRVAREMMSTGGSILFISSIHGQIGVPNRGAYSMSKAALGALARALAVELSPHGIRVNVLAPGPVDAGMCPDPEVRSSWEEETPAGRVARLEEVVHFADMLTSAQASFLSGQTIVLDGGVSTLRKMGANLAEKS